jgi:hypothetical protein
MKNRALQIIVAIMLIAGVVLVTSVFLLLCCDQQPAGNPQAQINAAVAATLASIPTHTPYPLPTPFPSPVPFSLDGLFCEYGFCIGHPADLYFIDEGARHNPPTSGSKTNGLLLGYNETLLIQMAWRVSDPNFDPQSAMQVILLSGETLQGNLDALLIGNFNVYYQPTTTLTDLLPFGGVAAWQCGGRDFIWKVYTPQDGTAQGLLQQALEKFRCEG